MAVGKVEDNAAEANKRVHAHVWANELKELMALDWCVAGMLQQESGLRWAWQGRR